MREIKFRAWDSLVKEMRSHTDPQTIQAVIFGNYYDGRVIVEQYTGVKDYIDKEICEGDIIECEYYPGLPTTEGLELVWRGVVYRDYGNGYHVKRVDGESGPYSISFSGSAVKRWEVIGNIHENPELLND